MLIGVLQSLIQHPIIHKIFRQNSISRYGSTFPNLQYIQSTISPAPPPWVTQVLYLISHNSQMYRCTCFIYTPSNSRKSVKEGEKNMTTKKSSLLMHSVHATRLCPRMQLHITAREIINIPRAHKRKLEKKEITQKVTRIINANGFPPSFELPFSLFYTHSVRSLQRRNLTRVISV